MDTININDEVTFKLSEYGKEVYINYWAELFNHYKKYNLFDEHMEPVYKEAEEDITMPIWNMANIFGEVLYMGNKLPFTSCTMKYHKFI